MSRVELFENQRAPGYDKFVENWIPGYHYFMSKLPDILSNIKSRELLVVGCGTGTEIQYILDSEEDWEITGIDPSPEMIQQAERNLAAFGQVNLISGVLTDLDTTTKYKAATLLLVLHFMPDDGTKLELLQNISDRLEQNAPFVLLDITGSADQIKNNLSILRNFLPADLEGEEVDARVRRIEEEWHAVPEGRLIELLKDAGFEAPIRFYQNTIYMGWMTKKK